MAINSVNNSSSSSSHQRRSSPPPRVNPKQLRRVPSLDNSEHSLSSSSSHSASSFVHSYKKRELPPRSHYLALDCEMVGGADGSSICARVVLVDWKGREVYDSYVAPSAPVADYRTFVSGITADHLVGAPPLAVVQQEVLELLKDKILVGHALVNDLQCLQIDHPWTMIRDTAEYVPFQQERFGVMVPRKLKDLCKEKLSQDIQAMGQAHSPAEDALAALNLYKQHRPRWEACIAGQIQKAEQQARHQARIEQQQQLWAQQQQQQPYYYHVPPVAPMAVLY